MQYKKLTSSQRAILRWRAKRNRLVAKLLAKDRHLSSQEALKRANALCGRMPRGK